MTEQKLRFPQGWLKDWCMMLEGAKLLFSRCCEGCAMKWEVSASWGRGGRGGVVVGWADN